MPPDDRSIPFIAADRNKSGTSRARTPNGAYRQLVARGLEPDEAANLTAYLAGIPIGDHAWTLREVNNLVFLRNLQIAGRFGPNDGGGSDRGD